MLKYYLHRSWSTKHHAASGFFSVLLAVGICTRLWFRSLDEHELGLRGSLASLIYEEAACLVRPETRSPVVWKVMKSSYSRQGCGFMEYAAGAQPTATVHTKQQRRFLPSVPDQQMRFLSPFWLVAQSLDVRPDINLGCFTADVPSGWRWQTALTLLSNINTPTTVQGGIALLCPVLSKPALKSSAVLLVWVKILIPRVLALSGFLWKKIDLAIQLSWTTLHAPYVLLLLLSRENQKGSFSLWKSVQNTCSGFNSMRQNWKHRKKNDRLHRHGVLPILPQTTQQKHEVTEKILLSVILL